ncbi:cupin domain-containing protein [Mucilaginibacter paludis]|uniref:Cupin 2 conserved barrel domain protein n=1 Tax=Mucilaginibacter paludis DSM 18603 TaxID=714943 RepID=H1Y9Y1_9SPHI|nr:cupin domain-containing protein [Mucilaginibacter paludis]EHQ24965.1 Cupin 2 conserved barrel domain protein [Mucilaginibacter paludis DSM 18603]
MKNNEDLEVKPVKGFSAPIEGEVLENSNFRKVLYTSNHMQVVLMSLLPGEDIGEEIHNANDQFFRFESGNGRCIINGNVYKVKDGDAIVVPAGAKHNVINTDAQNDLKMYTIYAPPHHKDGIVRETKKEAQENPEKFEGATTE